jgi:hypothetical protein
MIEIAEFEFDDRNRRHLQETARLDEMIITEVWSGRPVFAINEPAETRSGTHLMIGPDISGRIWTVVIVCVDARAAIWRAITGWPATAKEIRTWKSAS